MRRDPYTLPLSWGNELIIDNFAGGGGTSTGLEQAFGRPVDIAINHDPEALAMHAANHPHTKHLCESVWDVDPIKVTNNQPVGLVWLSPDCKHFSKAKGGKPVEKKIRGLAWVTLRWAAKCKPRVIMLENVEEFKTWGPLLIDEHGNAKPDPNKKGKTFESFVRQLKSHGYEVDYREMRACDFATPTIRKRFFLVARRDGIKIQWPAPTHGAPDSPGVKAGKLLPFRTAAECIDWSIPCPSIFERKKPLAEATLRRIAKGIMRYVVNAAEPFIVGQGGPVYSGKPVPTDKPFGTMTTENHRAVVVPSVTPVIVNTANSKTTGRGSNTWDVEESFRTITAKQGFAVVAPTIVPVTHQGSDRTESIQEPMRTVTGAHRGEKALMAATLVQTGYGEREGQAPRALDIEKPLGTVVGSAVKHACVSAFLAKHYTGVVGSDLQDPVSTVTSVDHNSLVTAFLTEHANATNQRVMSADEPMRTICAEVKGGHFSMVAANLIHMGHGEQSADGSKRWSHGVRTVEAPLNTITASGAVAGIITAHIQRDMGKSVGHAAAAPLGTVTAGGGGKSALVTAHIESLYSQKGNEARATDAAEPVKTITASARHALLTSNLVKLRGENVGSGMNEPLHTVSAQGQHHAEVRAFLLSYYGSEADADSINSPARTVTARDRFGLVTIHGQDYQIVDIGLRMLAPRELYRAQGFPEKYIIGDNPEQGLSLTKSAQVRMCGNSVCPPMARALIAANFTHEKDFARVA